MLDIKKAPDRALGKSILCLINFEYSRSPQIRISPASSNNSKMRRKEQGIFCDATLRRKFGLCIPLFICRDFRLTNTTNAHKLLPAFSFGKACNQVKKIYDSNKKYKKYFKKRIVKFTYQKWHVGKKKFWQMR